MKRYSLSDLIMWGIYGLSFLLPIFIIPSAYDSYVMPKWALLQSFTLLFVAGIMILPQTKISLRKTILIPLFVWTLWLVCTAFFAQSKALAITDIGHWLFILLLYSVFCVVIDSFEKLQRMMMSLLGAGLITAVWILLLDYHVIGAGLISKLPDWRGYLVAGMGNSDYVAGFLAAIWPVGLNFYLTSESRKGLWFWGTLLSLIAAALIVTYSVGSNGGLIIGLLVMLILCLYYRKEWFVRKIQHRLLGLGGILLLIILFYSVPNPWNGRGMSIFQQAFGSWRWKEGGDTRFVIWWNTLEIIKAHPITGVGAGNFTLRYLDTVSSHVLNNPQYRLYSGEYTNAAHNEILQAWAETGIVGVLLLLLIVGYVISLYVKALKGKLLPDQRVLIIGCLSGGIALGLYGMMSYPLHLPSAVLVAIVYAFVPTLWLGRAIPQNNIDQQSQPSWFRIIRTVFISVLLLTGLIWINLPLLAEIRYKQGEILSASGQKEEAFDYYDQAAIMADHADAQYKLGRLLIERGQLTEGIKILERCAQKRGDKHIRYDLATLYYLNGQVSKSIPLLENLVHNNPDDATYWRLMWLAQLKTGHKEAAEQAMLQWKKLEDKSDILQYSPERK